jgi:hypothetical protein
MTNKYLLILPFILFACSFQNIEESKKVIDPIYDFEVLYRHQGEDIVKEDKYRYKISSDSLYCIIESNFNNDTIVIESGKNLIYKGIVNTEPSSGVAKEIIIGDIENMKNLIIRINSGPPINFMLLKKEYNIIGIRKRENKVSVLFYKKVPVFY